VKLSAFQSLGRDRKVIELIVTSEKWAQFKPWEGGVSELSTLQRVLRIEVLSIAKTIKKCCHSALKSGNAIFSRALFLSGEMTAYLRYGNHIGRLLGKKSGGGSGTSLNKGRVYGRTALLRFDTLSFFGTDAPNDRYRSVAGLRASEALMWYLNLTNQIKIFFISGNCQGFNVAYDRFSKPVPGVYFMSLMPFIVCHDKTKPPFVGGGRFYFNLYLFDLPRIRYFQAITEPAMLSSRKAK